MSRELFINRQNMDGDSERIALHGYDSYQAWQRDADERRARYESRARFEQTLLGLDPDDLWFGWCGLCERQGNFGLPSIAAGVAPNVREELICRHCGTNARVRAALQIVKANVDVSNAYIYVTEQASPTYAWLQRNFRRVVGSEYVHDESKLRIMQQYLTDLGGHGKIRFEDVTGLSFRNASLDAVASFDVLEHVPDYARALREFARVLRPGGLLVLTAPFISSIETTVVRARLTQDGSIEHLLPPEYHGDPLGENGILCYYHFGWDLLDAVRSAGFSEASMALPWIPGMGLMGSLWTLTAIR